MLETLAGGQPTLNEVMGLAKEDVVVLRQRDGAVATVAEITSRTPATTLLASVEPCSKPDIAPITASGILNTAPRWQAAWWRSNGFLGGFISGLEHRSTLASSVVTWARFSRKVAPDAALLISEELGHRELPPKPGSYFGHRCSFAVFQVDDC